MPAITYAIRDDHVADSENEGLLATLCLAATEIIAGELLVQIGRSPGGGETIRLPGISLEPPRPPDLGLIDSGWKRLKPFLKTDPSAALARRVSAVTKPEEIS